MNDPFILYMKIKVTLKISQKYGINHNFYLNYTNLWYEFVILLLSNVSITKWSIKIMKILINLYDIINWIKTLRWLSIKILSWNKQINFETYFKEFNTFYP